MNILMCTDEEFAPATAVALRSFCGFNDPSAARVFIFHQGLPGGAREAITASVPRLREITFIEPALDSFVALGVPRLNEHYSAYLRLLAADALPSTVDRVVYIDSDVLVLDSLLPLWGLHSGDWYLQAALDDRLSAEGEHRAALLDRFAMRDTKRKPGYFNSGVLLLNLRRWRSEGFLEQLLGIARSNPQGLQLHDQDLLNLGAGDDWGELPPRWNLQTYSFFEDRACAGHPLSGEHERLLTTPAILHFTGAKQKPWMNSCRHPYRRVFHHYLAQTRFAGWSLVERPTLGSRMEDLVNAAKDRLRGRVSCGRRFRAAVERHCV